MEFTSAEIKYLLEHYPNDRTDIIAQHMNRSMQSESNKRTTWHSDRCCQNTGRIFKSDT